jgi:cofilin
MLELLWRARATVAQLLLIVMSCLTLSVLVVFFSFRRQSTGVVVDDEVATTFTAFKLNQGEKLRFYIYKIENKTKIVIDSKGDRTKTYDDFCAALPDDDCRYGLIDCEFTTEDGRPTSKLVFITWNPDTANIRSKMLYSGSKEALKTVLNGVSVHMNATDQSELDWETSVLPACRKFG